MITFTINDKFLSEFQKDVMLCVFQSSSEKKENTYEIQQKIFRRKLGINRNKYGFDKVHNCLVSLSNMIMTSYNNEKVIDRHHVFNSFIQEEVDIKSNLQEISTSINYKFELNKYCKKILFSIFKIEGFRIEDRFLLKKDLSKSLHLFLYKDTLFNKEYYYKNSFVEIFNKLNINILKGNKGRIRWSMMKKKLEVSKKELEKIGIILEINLVKKENLIKDIELIFKKMEL